MLACKKKSFINIHRSIKYFEKFVKICFFFKTFVKICLKSFINILPENKNKT